MSDVRASLVDYAPLGQFYVMARTLDGKSRNVTFFRGFPLEVSQFSFADPLGPKSFSFGVPGVTVYEVLGHEDTDWLVPETDIDLVLLDPDGTVELWWSGYITSFGWGLSDSGSSLSVDCKGALLQWDNFLAKPEYLRQPFTYEQAIIRQTENLESCRCSPLTMVWPSWWAKTYTQPANLQWYQVPADIAPGELWTGMLTRDTGSWNTVSEYILSLLTSMYTERGQWTISLLEDRRPVLHHRDNIRPPDEILEVLITSPGVTFNLSEDWSQSVNVIYGQGKSLDGVSYSGLTYAGGNRVFYEPLAASAEVYPTIDNAFFQPSIMRKEVSIELTEGITPYDAHGVGDAHLRKYSRPGLTGSVTLKSDLVKGGAPVSRFRVRAGEHIRLRGLFGNPAGQILHISEVTVDLNTMTTTLTVDAKFRDSLTVAEVNQRGRDSMATTRGIIAGGWSPPIPDMLFPWSDEMGSGVVPSGSTFSAKTFFNTMPDSIRYPWDEWTKTYPPKLYPQYYARIGPCSANASENWSVTDHPSDDVYHCGYPVLMSQSGTIKTVQVAAFDRDGNVKKVPFHFSLWWANTANEESAPWITGTTIFPPGVSYPTGQFYPYGQNAWDGFKADGTTVAQADTALAYQGSMKVVAYGVYGARAGFYPSKDNANSTSTAATGLLVDDTGFNFTATEQFDIYNDVNLKEPQWVTMCALFYCDAQGASEVFFLGKLVADPSTK